MQKDVRISPAYIEAERICKHLFSPGSGQIIDAADLHVAPNGKSAVFSGMMVEKLEGSPPTRLCQVDLISGELKVLTFGPRTDRLPKYAPHGRHIAFLSDRDVPGTFQLYLLDSAKSAASAAPAVDGSVEYLDWSPDSSSILLGVAGHGADRPSTQGAIQSQTERSGEPAWLPTVATEDESSRWRRIWLYDLRTNSMRQLSRSDINVWEAGWCGNRLIAAVASRAHQKGFGTAPACIFLRWKRGIVARFTRLGTNWVFWRGVAPEATWLSSRRSAV